jgi:serine/threonine protein kinase
MQRLKYRILGLIGQGQYGRVYCATNRETGEMVALKDLNKNRFPTRLFLREFTHLTNLQHPNIVSSHGIEYSRTGRYLVMDYCAGGTLRDLLVSESKLSLVCGLKLIVDILSGLEHAHDRGIVHCDLKPENILLKIEKEGWTACISDFGIARLKLEAGGQGTAGGDTGSPAYMAPERFYAQFSPASDLYAVGIMLYELVVGERPFSGMPGQLMSAHLNQQLKIPKSVPFLLRSIIATALRKLPQRRFAGAGEMLQAVQLALDVIEAQKYSTACLSIASRDLSLHSPKILHQESFSKPIDRIAIDGRRVYLATCDRVIGRVYDNEELQGEPLQQWQVKLDAPLIQISLCDRGGCVFTQSQDFYSVYAFSHSNSKTDTFCDRPILSVKAKNLVTAIDPNGNWLAIASDKASESPQLQAIALPNGRLLATSSLLALPSQLIALDRHHGLAIFSSWEAGNDSTDFRLFNRRGGIFEIISLPMALQVLSSGKANGDCLFAIEKSDPPRGILMNLKPLKITRIALEIIPEFVIAREWGYLLAERTGQVRLIDCEGKPIGGFKLPFSLNAIDAFGKFKLLAATQLEGEVTLHTIDFQETMVVEAEEDYALPMEV